MMSEVGLYLYAFLSHEDPPPLTGIDGRSPLGIIAEEGIAALVSPVSLADFGEEALRRKLDDLEWLEEKVRLHEAIVEAAQAKGAVLPMRFATILLDEEGIRAIIRRNAPRIRDALEFLRDKVEWGVKAFVNPEALRAAVLRDDPALVGMSRESSASPPGHAFFLRRKINEGTSAKCLEREEVLVQQFLEAIRKTVVDLSAVPPLLPETSRAERMIFNLACLVWQEGVEAFLAHVEQWNRGHADEGFRLVTSGPWPPYHFVPRLDGDE